MSLQMPPIPPQASAILHHPRTRYAAIALACVLSMHLLLGLSASSSDFKAMGVVTMGGAGSDAHDTWYQGARRPVGWQPSRDALAQGDLAVEQSSNGTIVRQNATFVTLARNSDLWDLMKSIREVEDRFNHRYHYPWVFLNEQPFDDQFKFHTTALCSGKTYYGQITDPNEWPPGDTMPKGINTTEAWEAINEMGKKPIPYGGSLPYRKMCRYQSGFFWRHSLLDQFEYYWRVEPSVKFYCDILYDPFELMVREKKKYVFVISLYEYGDTIKTLWDTTKAFIKANPQYLAPNNAMKWLSNDGGETYNLCHFWSNFEIASLSLWRSEAYRAYFDALEASGGFFLERWGDAPAHSIAAALFLNRDEIHFANSIGYFHLPFLHCPLQENNPTCACDSGHQDAFEFHGYSCTPRWKQINTFT